MEKKSNKSHRNPKNNMTNISKTMCYILRHQADKHGIQIESSGFIKLEDLLNSTPMKKFHVTNEIIFDIVREDDKGRYEIENRPPYYIRAVQGHSIKSVKDEDILELISNIFEYPIVIHGTYLDAWNKIKETGLNRMSRNSIHFSIGYKKEDHVISGMRHNCEVFIEINAVQAFYNNIKFFVSKNKVVLTAGINGVINPKYFKKVLNTKGNILYSQNYEIGIEFIFENNNQINGIFKIIDLTSENKNIIYSDKFDDLNQIPRLLLSDEKFIELIKKPFVILIDKNDEDKYVNLIKSNQDSIDNLAFYHDYILINSDILQIDSNYFNSGNIKRIDLDFKRHYEKLNNKNLDENLLQISLPEDKKPKEKTDKNVTSDLRLNKNILLDNSIDKNYLLLFLNYEEEDILSTIDYILIPNGKLEEFKNFQFKLETKLAKENMKNFLEQLKNNLIKEKVFDKLLILCTSKEDLTYLNSLLKKNSIQAPKLLHRNIIILNPSDFAMIEHNDYKMAAEIFLIQYVLDESTIEKIKIQL